MRVVGVAVGVAVVVGFIASGCRGGTPEDDASSQAMASMPASAPPAAVPPQPPARQGVDITLKTVPDPPKVGENAFEAMVMADGQAVTDARVSVELLMPAMPSMKMPEMRGTVTLTHESGGRYRGVGDIMAAGDWDATVKLMRGGQDGGARTFRVTAK